MKKKILTLGIITVLATTLIGAGTYALFTSKAVSGPTNISAGTIYLSANRDDGDSVPGPMFYFDNNTDGAARDGLNTPGSKQEGYWYPGKTSGVKVLEVHNGSLANPSIPINLDWIEAVVEDQTNNGVDDTILKNALWIKIKGPSGAIKWEGYLSDMTDGKKATLSTPFPMAATSIQFINFEASMPLDPPGNDNDYQGKDIKVQFKVHATQQ